MAKTQNADSGCFKGIFRRILCQGSLQTHPSDQIPDEKKKPVFNEPKLGAKIEASGDPGIVARLMGLESLPEVKWLPKGKAPESVTRSRSVNFMDYLLKFNAAQAHHHRRVRTSVSFREVPAMWNQQNHELFVVSLDEEDEKQMKSKVRKDSDLKQKKEEKSKNKEEENQGTCKKVSKFIDEPRRVSVKRTAKIKNCKGANGFGVVLPGKNNGNKESEAALRKKKSPVKKMDQNEISAKERMSKKRKNQVVIEEVKPAECSSENSSPVSVLDVNDFPIFGDTPISDEQRYMELNFKRKPSLKTTDWDYPSSSLAPTLSCDDLDQLRVNKKKGYESMDNRTTEYYSELVAKLHKFTEQAILQSNWVPNKMLNFEDLEEICMEFGQHILELLLQQVIDELVGFKMEI